MAALPKTVDRAYYAPSYPRPMAEVFPLPIENGNPVFDFKTPRKVVVKSIYDGVELDAQCVCPSIKNFYGHGFSGDEILFEYESDSEGNLVLDEFSRPKKIPVIDADNPNIPNYQKWYIAGIEVELDVPKDNYKIKQLLRWARNASVPMIDGLSTIPIPKVFYIYDQELEQKSEQVKRQRMDQAVSYVRNIQEKAIMAYAIFIGTIDNAKPIKKRDGSLHYDVETLRFDLETFARENSKEFLDETKYNMGLNQEVLLALADYHNVIKDNSDGYYYYPQGGKPVNIGSTADSVLSYLREHQVIRRDVQERSHYRDFLDDTPVEIKDVVLDGGSFSHHEDSALAEAIMKQAQADIAAQTKEAISVKDGQIEALRAQVESLMGMVQKTLANPPAQSIDPGKERKKPGPKPGSKRS